jgi:hypothetical protein
MANKTAILAGLGGALALGFLAISSKASGEDKPLFDRTFPDGSRVVVFLDRKIAGKAGERYRTIVAVTGGGREEMKVLAASVREKSQMLVDANFGTLDLFEIKESKDGLLVTTEVTLAKDRELTVTHGFLYPAGGGARTEMRAVSIEKIGAVMLEPVQATVPAAPDFRYVSKEGAKQMMAGGGWMEVPADKIPAGAVRDQLMAVATRLKASPTAAPHLAAGEVLLTRPFAEHDLMRIVMNKGNLEVWARM